MNMHRPCVCSAGRDIHARAGRCAARRHGGPGHPAVLRQRGSNRGGATRRRWHVGTARIGGYAENCRVVAGCFVYDAILVRFSVLLNKF